MTLTRRKIAMVMAEFLGTALLVLIVLGVRYRSGVQIPYFIGLAAATALAASMFVFGRVSGAHLNPIVTIGMWSVRRVKALPAIVYVAAQMLGAFVAYQLFTYLLDTKLTGLESDFEGRVLVAEAVGAFIFSLGWAAVVYRRMEAAQAAAVVGMTFFLGVLVASISSTGLVNPALALATQSWVWGTYVLGPVLGAIIGFNLYSLLFAPTSELIREGEEERAQEEKSAKPAKSSKKK